MQRIKDTYSRLNAPASNAELLSRDLINKQLARLGLGIGAATAGGIGGLAINGYQGEPASFGDNAVIDGLNAGIGGALLGGGIGAASVVPGVLSRNAEAQLARLRMNDLVARKPEYQARVNNVIDARQARRAGGDVRARALGRAGIGAGLTAAGAGLVNLISQFSREPDAQDYEGLNLGGLAAAGGLTGAAILAMENERPVVTDPDSIKTILEKMTPEQRRAYMKLVNARRR